MHEMLEEEQGCSEMIENIKDFLGNLNSSSRPVLLIKVAEEQVQADKEKEIRRKQTRIKAYKKI